MRTVDTHGSFEDVITASDPHVQQLARHVRSLIAEVYPEVVEVPWPNQKTVGYGLGPRKMSEHFCWISVHRSHVNLGFNYGADLPDPDHLLDGSGKRFRHIKLRRAEGTKGPGPRRLLEAAIGERRTALGIDSDP